MKLEQIDPKGASLYHEDYPGIVISFGNQSQWLRIERDSGGIGIALSDTEVSKLTDLLIEYRRLSEESLP